MMISCLYLGLFSISSHRPCTNLNSSSSNGGGGELQTHAFAGVLKTPKLPTRRSLNVIIDTVVFFLLRLNATDQRAGQPVENRPDAAQRDSQWG